MLDHVFVDVISALRDGFEGALLEQLLVEERFQADILAGDLTWQCSYALPGEANPPKAQADVTLEWSTWCQSTYRTWRLGESLDEPVRVGVELVVRLQRLVNPPDAAAIAAGFTALPDSSAVQLESAGLRVEAAYDSDLANPESAFELGWEGTVELSESALSDPGHLDGIFGDLGGWVASNLVRLADLQLDFLPPDEDASTR